MIKAGDFYRNPDENLDYANKQNSEINNEVTKQLDDDLEKELVKEKLEVVFDETSIETSKSIEIGRCEKRPELNIIKRVIRLDL